MQLLPLFSFSALTIGLIAVIIFIERNRRKLLKDNEQIRQELETIKKKADFLLNIAHELKTPVSLIHNPIRNLMERKDISSDDASVMKNILKQTDRLSHMISILHDSNTHEITLSKEDLNRWLNIQMEDYRIRCDSCGLNLDFKPEYGIGDIVFDKDIVSSTLSDVIDTVIRKCEAGNVSVLTSERKGYYRITVTDRGNSRTSQTIDHLSRLVYKSDKDGCCGTGLSYAQVMIGLLGGHILTEEDNEDNTCTFHIDIPVSISEDMVSNGDITAGQLITVQTDCGQSCMDRFDTRNSSLLFVDDDPDLLEYMKNDYCNLFRKIYTALDGREALEIARNKMPDVIVSDIIMPRMNGFDLCSIIKSDIDLGHIPVILLTSRSNTRNQETGYKMGADCFVAKPFDSKIMYNMIANQLKNRWEIKKQYSTAVFSIMDKDKTFSNADEQFILKLNSVIKDNMSNPNLSVTFLADELSVSRTTLFTKMNNLLGVSASHYIKNVRIEAAKELIIGTDMPIADIAKAVGFSVGHYFSSVFKETTGLTPREFKEQCKFGTYSPNH